MIDTIKHIISAIAIALASSCEPIEYQNNTNTNFAIPQKSESAILIEHEGFTVSYVDKHKQAEWVAYRLIGEDVEKKIPRTNKYTEDPLCPNCATDSDYKYSGYDRGHLFPAANAWTENIMKESFYFTNICPQDNSFNSGVWNRLETLVREWAVKYDTIHVVTGSILSDGLKTIGNNKVSVPKYMYKVVVVNTDTAKQGIAFLIENKGSNIKDYEKFALTIDELEELTNLDFCTNLPDYLETEIESSFNYGRW